MISKTEVTIGKYANLDKIRFDSCDLWPLTLTFFCKYITVLIVMNPKIRWEKHSLIGVTDGQTDKQTNRQMDSTVNKAVWSQVELFKKKTSVYVQKAE